MRHGSRVLAVAFSPDGTRLATAGEYKTVRLWEVVTGKELAQIQHDGEVRAVAFSPDSTRIATACKDRTVRLWSA